MHSKTLVAAASVALLSGLAQANGTTQVTIDLTVCSGSKCDTVGQQLALGGQNPVNRPVSSITLVGIQAGGPGETYDLKKVTCTLLADNHQHTLTSASPVDISTNSVTLQWVDCEYNSSANSTVTSINGAPTASTNGTTGGNSTLSTTHLPKSTSTAGGSSTTGTDGSGTSTSGTGASGTGASATGSSASATGTSGSHTNGATTTSVSSIFALAVVGLVFGYVL